MADICEWFKILNEIRAATDTVGSQNPPDSTSADPGLNGLANRTFKRMYDKVVEATPQDWVFAQAPITTVAGKENYDLTTLIPDLYRPRFLDQVVSFNTNNKVNLLPYKEEERNSYFWGNPKLIQGGVQLLVSYSPKAPWLQEYASLTLNSANGIDGIVFTAVQPGLIGLNASVQIIQSGAPGISIGLGSNHYQIQIFLGTTAGINTIQNVLAAIQGSAAASAVLSAASLNNLQSDTVVVAAATNFGGTVAFDFISGWSDYVIDAAAAKLMGRLDLDPTFHLGQAAESMANLSAMSAVRDSGHSDSLRDEEMEAAGAYPFSAPLSRTYVYRFQGTNLSIRAIYAGAGAY